MRELQRASILLLCALLLGPQAAARSLQQVLNHGTLRVGVALAAPWAMRADGRDLAGFEIEVANKLAEDLGVRADIVVYGFDELIPALESGEIDIIAAGLSITPARALHVNFSQPYASGGITLATNSVRTAGVQRFEQLDAETYKIAAVENSVAAELARRLLPEAQLLLFATTEAASAALRGPRGRIPRGRARTDVPRAEHAGTIDADRPAVAPNSFGFRRRQGRCRLPRLPQCLDRRPRSRYVALDGAPLLVQVARVAESSPMIAARTWAPPTAGYVLLAALGTPGLAQEDALTLPPRLDSAPREARLAATPEGRPETLEEVIVVGGSEWRLPDLGSAWRARAEAAVPTERIAVSFMPLYDPERAVPNFDPLGINRELQRVGFIELFRVEFGGKRD
jgi:polar amino acid transport system substrate-binding protein